MRNVFVKVLKHPGMPGRLSRLSVQLVGFGSGHYLAVHGLEPRISLCADRAEPAWDSLSLSLSLTQINKINE